MESYAAAVTGQSATQPLPIGAKIPSAAKASEKLPSGAIGAPLVAKLKATPLAGNVPAGTASPAKQDPPGQQDANITPDSALEFLANTPGDHTPVNRELLRQRQARREVMQLKILHI